MSRKAAFIPPGAAPLLWRARGYYAYTQGGRRARHETRPLPTRPGVYSCIHCGASRDCTTAPLPVCSPTAPGHACLCKCQSREEPGPEASFPSLA
eukprot:scaffold862_cov52-Phaeocystis_antarctica.AAC.2